MNCHQVLSGACNSGDQCFAVGSVEGIPFTAYAAGCNIVILASNFERVQIIPGAIHGYVRIGSLDCSTDTGKIAAAYGAEVCIFEPTPLIHTAATTHGLEYRWVQTGKLVADGPITALSWNLEGTRLLTGGKILQLWHQASLYQEDSQPNSGVTFQIGGSDKDDKPKQQEEEEPGWICVWRCHTATPAHHLAFSPDGVLFATSGINDRLVKIWYQNKVLVQTHGEHSPTELNYTFIYVAHPRAVTHLSWRKTSKYMPKGSVGNVLVTSCVDNICRVWAETLLPEDEWGGGCVTSHARSPPRRQRATHRHKHRFMQRLKHMKTCFHIRRNAQSSKQPGAPIPTLPSTYSAHDFHNPYHASSYTGGLHFHLAASINAETDIPLVPSLAGGGRFILHWLHNKEMHFTSQAEAILHDLTKKILDKEDTDEGSGSDPTHPEGESETRHRRPSHHLAKTQSEDNSNSDEQPANGNHSHPSLSNTTSINSIATDVTCTHLPDSLDAKIESLLRDWYQSPDLLFSIHPVDGSFLIWVCEWLDELQAGAIRQAQVSFSARIPAAFPLGDATTMCTPAALYHAAAQPLYVRHRTKPQVPGQQQHPDAVTTPLASVQEEKEENEWPQNEEQSEPKENVHRRHTRSGPLEENNNEMQRKTSVAAEDSTENQEGDVLDSAPVISMVTNHTNGTLNLWQLTFDDKSKFSQVLSIGHASRASGHRFRVNDITCHPVLPLLLTTSHHNISDNERENQKVDEDTAAGGLCSELIMWRVECVGPLGKSGGVSELARVNSPHLSAFSNVAWLPTLLPSTTLGNLSNSPSACFVASDGESLRVFQAVIDARTLLAEIATSERRHNDVTQHHDTMSLSSESTLEEGGIPLHDRIKIVSQQSTARPGAIIQLHAIADATHDWHNTQLLHVFQEQLITGERTAPDSETANTGGDNSDVHTITEAGLEAIVDLRKAAVFNEPFYIVVLERTDGGSTVHMWRLTVSSQADPAEDFTNSMMYVPDSALVQEEEGESRKNSVSMDQDRAPVPPPPHSYLSITTKKVCECPLSLPDAVDVIHATPAAGHLSSASIYPACLAPYTLATACSDNTLRFWKCHVMKKDNGEFDYTWKEWEMMNKDQESTIDTPGQPLHISAAYSGRIACAYKCGKSFTRPKGNNTTTNSNPNDARFVNLCVCVYECESTGGAEWLLEDTIPLRNVSLPRVGVCTDTQIDLSYLHDTSFMQKKQRLTQVLQTFSSEERSNNRNGEGDTGKSAGLLAVPSFSTLQSLRKSIMENGNTCPLTQKHLVQLDWVSKEDGSHILTVAVGSRVLLFTPVSSDLAQANLKAMKESINNNRPILRKASSLAAPLFIEEIRWMQLRRIELKTADGLPPLPMQISWVRDGILVVGMDSEMHVYSQWKPENPQSSSGQFGAQEQEEGGESRALRDSDLRVSAPHLQRVSSINLQLLERDARRRNKTQPDQPQPLLDYMPDYGLFEASQMACPVLPQYHPKQLMELLNSGKIRWVKAILAHLVRCIGGSYTGRNSQGDEDSLSRQRGWSRSRTLSVSFAAGAGSPLDGVTQITEDVQLDYAELTSVPPLPLWTLLVADKESPHHPSTVQEAKDYNDLFDGTMDTDDDLDALLLGEEEGVDRRPSMPERQPLSHFGPRQGRILSRLLTHTHLPGLSSLDQMHLLALADTVSTCDADFAERFATNAKVDVAHSSGQEILPDSLDDCGLRFLLAMKHYGYLLRCLPIAQRAALQRTGVGTCNLVWAFHSETHEQLLALVPGYAKGQPKWSTMRELGVGWWVRGDLLRTCMERLACAAYKQKQDPLDAALYYLAMKKRMLLWGLFRSHRDERMTAFFANDFTEDRWRKAALTNAYVLLGKQRFEHAAAFFLLGGALKDALEVLITRLGDLQLAMVVARLYESDSILPPSLKKLLMDEILGGETEDGEIILERAHPDPFVRSMALWELKRYGEALDTLLNPAGRLHAARDNEPTPSVFNFYVYLRTHPRLKRHNLPSQGGTLALLQQETEEGITRLERRLYFQTAHGHFKAGCPALALEVLSKLPARIRDEKPRHPVSVPSVDETIIHTGQLVEQSVKKEEESLDWGSSAADVDWGAPVSSTKNDELVLSWDDEDDKGSGGSGASTPPLEMKMDKKEEPLINGEVEKEKESEETVSVDIMAQQLKFVACLKILMEELSTLATGFEVDGGHLRYQLYIWLEREVEALRRLCGYSAGGAGGVAGGAAGGAIASGAELVCADAEPPPLPERPTLHQLLMREKADFEAKVQRAVRRKKWLKANETLLRTLLSYCSLHGAGGGGLASVRMELILLLQELGQDKQHQQLLSPLPFPTTLPLLAAAVATNNTVVADPVRHLQSMAHDMLATTGELGIPGGSATRLLHTLRELSVALSACIYQSLCDSDTFSVKHSPHHDSIIAETPGTSNLLARQRRHSTEELVVTTIPSKWPGVSALRGLALRAAEEEDSPRLAVLLAEAFCAAYLALLGWALAARDAHLLYRLAAHEPDARAHARLFGGGVRRLLTTAPAPAPAQPKLIERTEGTSVWSSLRDKRNLLNMRILGLGPTAPHKNIQEGRPTYREQFVPPQCSILTYLLTKPTAEQDPENYDYDSAESGAEDADESDSDVDDDDIFNTNTTTKSEKRRKGANFEHSDPDSYSWYVMRVAVLRLAQQKLQHFLQLCGIEMSELATTSPTVHAALRRVDQWQQQLTETLESRPPPPDFIPGCFPEQQTSGPPINKYRCLLEKHNTPFNSALFSTAPARRLWSYLVRQEPVQELFIRAVFSRRRAVSTSQSDGAAGGGGGSGGSGCVPHPRRDDSLQSPVRIIHKEQDSIAAFCLNRVGGGLLAVATAREVQEMDVSLLLRGDVSWAEDECDVDLMGLSADPAALPDTGFLLIQHQDRPNNGSVPGTGNTSPLNTNAPQVPIGMASQTGRGASVQERRTSSVPTGHEALIVTVLKHKIDNIKRMAAHPSQPLYLTGGADGSVQLWEWGHTSCVWSPRAPGAFAKVTRVRFSDYGNKFAASDADGNLAMWQLQPSAQPAPPAAATSHQQHQPHQSQASARPFFTHQCHSKGISDFVFLGSCSLVATAGHSSESKNVAIWDTLMPTKKALVVSWTCHEGGAACVAWAGGALVSCGRRGDVLVWDLRARAPRHKLHAHHAPLKCLALSPREDLYAVGAADGDIKVFSLATHQLLHTFAGEHARSSFFKHIGQGVTQIHIDNAGRLFSCGADGTMKVRKLPERDTPSLHHHQY
ncbi:dmX-like protein 1 isoform X3 [Galleria mellonella]|uniref:DmX-like protein 1 isoform X3 n=1 Tax=Galleria mellonella TaxID=7137 RepID=A0ABM3ML76_GALME|nr:dmX-like protein 1 isoform X3 [Galleria mellonella]